MTVEISAIIEGDFDFTSPTDEIWFKERRFLLYKESDACYIAFRVDVNDPESYYPKEFDTNGNMYARFEELDIFDEAIRLFQYIESIGAYDFNVEKIHWEQSRIKFTPQTRNEQEKYSVFQQSKTRVHKGSKAVVDWARLSDIINHRNKLEQFNFPLSFYREGNLAFQNGENRRAFLMHYMMLELLYINEKETSHSLTKQKFSKATELTKAIEMILKTLKQPEYSTHLLWLQDKCKFYNKNIDADGFRHVLVNMRGSLAHGLEKTSGYIFSDKELYTLAFLTSYIAKYVCGMLQTSSFTSENLK